MKIVFGMRKLERAPTALLLESLGRLEPAPLPIRELEDALQHMATPSEGPADELPDPHALDLSLDVVETEALESMLEVLRLARDQILERHGVALFALLFVHLVEIHTLWALNEHATRGEMAYAN